jgi:DNA-binding response OmpR family regulator
MHILIIEDDQKIAGFIAKGLKEERMSVDVTPSGEEGFYLAQTNRYDVIVVDWMLPGLAGPELIKHLRARHVTVPALMLTARDDIDDRVEGLESGADDYLNKPFAFAELVARIKALYRRSGYDDASTLQADTLTLDPLTREVIRDNKRIDLTAREYKLLEYLLRHKNRTVTNTMITESIWSMNETIESNVINVTICHLRKKIDSGFDKKLIRTVRGSGYRLAEK